MTQKELRKRERELVAKYERLLQAYFEKLEEVGRVERLPDGGRLGTDPKDTGILYGFMGILSQLDSELEVLYQEPVETPQKADKAPKKPTLKRADYASLFNDQAIKAVFKPWIEPTQDGGQIVYQVNQAPADRKAVYVSITLDGGEKGVSFSNRLTLFDKIVLEAVTSYALKHDFKKGPLVFTVAELWRFMTGRQDGRKDTSYGANIEAEIVKSLEKLSATRAHIDTTGEQAAGYLGMNIRKFERAYNLLYSVGDGKYTAANGKEVVAYAVFAIPIFADYAQEKNHLRLFPYAVIEATAKLCGTTEALKMRQYLLNEIRSMTAGTRDNKTIRLETLYRETGITPPETAVEKKRHRDKIAALLQAWVKIDQRQVMNISGFDWIKQGGKYEAVKIRQHRKTDTQKAVYQAENPKAIL